MVPLFPHSVRLALDGGSVFFGGSAFKMSLLVNLYKILIRKAKKQEKKFGK